MGMFDTVKFDCPDCKETISEQTKSGPCNLNEYFAHAVPLSIAGCLDGDVLSCPLCRKDWRVRVASTKTVPLELVAEADD